MRNLVKSNWFSLSVIAVVAGWVLWQLPNIPQQMPSHMDYSGNIDKFDDKTLVLLMIPLVNIATIFLISDLARLSPKGFQMPNSQNVIGIMNAGVTLFLMAIYVGLVREALNPHEDAFVKMLIPGFALFMVFTGNFFGKLERNFFIGIRLPWTLASDKNWKHTHRFAGKAFVVGGLVAFALAFSSLPVWAPFATLAVASILAIVYSLVYFLRFERDL